MSSLPALFFQQCIAEVRAQTDELQRDLYYKTQKAGKKILKIELKLIHDVFQVINILRIFQKHA